MLETSQPTEPFEAAIAYDMVRRALPVAPLLVILAALPWGVDGALSAGFAIALVVGNLALSAVMLAGASRVSLGLLMFAALFGYFIRLGLVFLAVLLVKDMAWVELVPLGLTLIVTHLGLLLWETRYVSATLAFPGVRPSAPSGRPGF